MKRKFLLACGFVGILALTSCNGDSKPSPESRNYESSYNSSNTVTSEVEDDPYLDNSVSTGTVPYSCRNLKGDGSTISVSTSGASECDVVVIVKSGDTMIRNAYIKAGGSYTFNIPMGITKCSSMVVKDGIQTSQCQMDLMVVSLLMNHIPRMNLYLLNIRDWSMS